ncbi:MAG: autoinducer 2 ABC transporter substrate-binding protein, partial [Planctomycetes bacterium]|nr:autoinducer 2 ABC transporter substrate-binding protein [Planctomycetota bacterium]
AMLVLDKKPITDGMDIPKVGKAKLVGRVLTVHNVLPITKENVDQFDF